MQGFDLICLSELLKLKQEERRIHEENWNVGDEMRDSVKTNYNSEVLNIHIYPS